MFKLKFIGDKEIVEKSTKIGRSCGGCSLCCYLLEVEELKIPPRCVCPHQYDDGCLIYISRPRVCRDFACRWLVDDDFPEDWKPSKTGLVIYFGEGQNLLNCDAPSTLNIHSRDKFGWQKSEYYPQIREWAIEGLTHNLDGLPREPNEQIYYKTIIHDHDEQYIILPHDFVNVTKSFYMMNYNTSFDDWKITKFPSKEDAQKFAENLNNELKG